MFSRKFLFTSSESHFSKVRLDLNCHTVWQFKLCQNDLATTGNNRLDTLIKLMIESSQHSSHVKDKIKLKVWCCLCRRKDREETPRGICPTCFLSSKQKRVASWRLFFSRTKFPGFKISWRRWSPSVGLCDFPVLHGRWRFCFLVCTRVILINKKYEAKTADLSWWKEQRKDKYENTIARKVEGCLSLVRTCWTDR